jgi:hypothetical protein
MYDERSNRGTIILLIIIAALVISNIYIYMTLQSQVSSLVNEKNSMQTQIDTLQAINTTYHNYMGNYSYSNLEYEALWLNYTTYVETHSYNTTQYDALVNETEALNDEIDSLKAAKLILINLEREDIRPWQQIPYVHFTGQVCNVGTNAALNCKIHVIAYQGTDVAFTTDIPLGNINGESSVNCDKTEYYSGSAITDYSVTLEWTS